MAAIKIEVSFYKRLVNPGFCLKMKVNGTDEYVGLTDIEIERLVKAWEGCRAGNYVQYHVDEEMHMYIFLDASGGMSRGTSFVLGFTSALLDENCNHF